MINGVDLNYFMIQVDKKGFVNSKKQISLIYNKKTTSCAASKIFEVNQNVRFKALDL